MDSEAVLFLHLKDLSFWGGETTTLCPKTGVSKGTNTAATVNIPSSHALSDSQDQSEDTEWQPKGLARIIRDAPRTQKLWKEDSRKGPLGFCTLQVKPTKAKLSQ